MSTYFAILTAIGEAQISNAAALGRKIKIQEMSIGDGAGTLPTPDRLQTALINEVYRANLNSLHVDDNNDSQVVAEMVIPETEGGWWIREIGLRDDEGQLIAVANAPPSYKPQMAEGSGRTQVVRIILIVSSTEAVQLKVDPAVVLATRETVERTMREHVDNNDPHSQYAKADDLEGHKQADDPYPQYARAESVQLESDGRHYRIKVIKGSLALEEIEP